jgi:hypothetical protein
MRKLILMVLCPILTISLTACSGSGDLSETSKPTTTSEQTAPTSETPGTDIKSGGDATPATHTEGNTNISLPANFADSAIQGKIRNLFYAGSPNTVIISADKLYLYDLAAQKVIAETGKESFNGEAYYPIKNGYVGIGMKMPGGGNGGGLVVNSSAPGYVIQFYDSSLAKGTAISLDTILKSGEMVFSELGVAVSSDGNSIAIASNIGLTLYNVSTKQKTILIDCRIADNTGRKGISMIEQVAFVNGDKSIVFQAQSFDVPPVNGKSSYATYGFIDTNGANLSNAKCDGMTIRAVIPYSGFTFLIDEYRNPSGKFAVLDNSTNKTTLFSLTTKKESCVAFGSDKGAYFATSEITNSGIVIRVYNAPDGKLAYEKTIQEDARHMERDPEVKILDGSKTLIVLLGNRQSDISTIILCDQF